MTAPLQGNPVTHNEMPPDKFLYKSLTAFIDTGWMSEKKMKWIGWDGNGNYAWVTPNGMMYTIKDLERTELGEEYEKEVTEGLQAEGDGSGRLQHLSLKEFYEWEVQKQKNCEFCPKGQASSPGDAAPPPPGGGIGEKDKEDGDKIDEQDATPPDWRQYVDGIAPDMNSNPVAEAQKYAGQYGGAGGGYGNAGTDAYNEAMGAAGAAMGYGGAGGGYGDGYAPSPENPVLNNGVVKTNADVVTAAISPLQKLFPSRNTDEPKEEDKKGGGSAGGGMDAAKKLADDFKKMNGDKILRAASPDATVIMNVVFEGVKDSDGTLDNTTYPIPLQIGKPGGKTEVYQVYVIGFKEREGLSPIYQHITGRWLASGGRDLPIPPPPRTPLYKLPLLKNKYLDDYDANVFQPQEVMPPNLNPTFNVNSTILENTLDNTLQLVRMTTWLISNIRRRIILRFPVPPGMNPNRQVRVDGRRSTIQQLMDGRRNSVRRELMRRGVDSTQIQ